MSLWPTIPVPEAREMGRRESAEVLARDFDIDMPDSGFPQTKLQADFTPSELDALLGPLSERSTFRAEAVHTEGELLAERQRIAQDLAFAEFKKKGGQFRREVDRDLVADLNSVVTNNLGLRS